MEITVSNKEPEGWDGLVKNCPWGSFYHSPANLKLIQHILDVPVHFISYHDAGKLLGGISFTVQEGPLGKVVSSLPYFGSYGDAVIDNEATVGVEKIIYQKLVNESQRLDALCLNVVTSPFATKTHHRNVRNILNPTFVDKRCCQIVHLPEYNGESRVLYSETILKTLHGRARTAYRKIVNSHLERKKAETEDEVMAFAEIHMENIGAKGGQFKTKDFFHNVFEMTKARPDVTEISVMMDNDKLTGGVILFYYNSMVEYHTTCLQSEYRSIGPLNRIIVDKMIEAGMADYRFWNFGGTWESQVGVYKFKQSFGALEHTYYYYTVFLRDLEKIREMSPGEIIKGYPLSYVIPFKELSN